MAVKVHPGLGETSVGFALSYAAFRIVLIAQYLSAAYFVPVARPLVNWYARGYCPPIQDSPELQNFCILLGQGYIR